MQKIYAIIVLIMVCVKGHIEKGSFYGIDCLGKYDKPSFARLDRLCFECFTLYRDESLHRDCRENCFKNEIFECCLQALLLENERSELERMVNLLNGNNSCCYNTLFSFK